MEPTTQDARPVFAGMAADRAPLFEPVPNRILMITAAFVRGGSERRMAGTAAALSKKGFDLRLIASRAVNAADVDLRDQLSALGLDARLAPMSPLPDDTERNRVVERSSPALRNCSRCGGSAGL